MVICASEATLWRGIVLLTVTYPGVPGSNLNLPPYAAIADGAGTGCNMVS